MRTIQRGVACVLIGLLAGASVLAQDRSVWDTKKSGWQLLSGNQRQTVFDYAEKFKSYLRVARTALTSNREMIQQAHSAGFVDFTDGAQVKPGARLIINGRDRSVILAVIGTEPITSGSHLV